MVNYKVCNNFKVNFSDWNDHEGNKDVDNPARGGQTMAYKVF